MDYSFHTVQKGDTLSEIASHYGVDAKKLADFNNLKNMNKIREGQVIMVPQVSSAEGKSDKYTPPEPTKGTIQPEGTSFPAHLRGGPVPQPSPSEAPSNPYDLINFGERPPGMYPDRVAARVFEQIGAIGKSITHSGKNVYDILSGKTPFEAYDPTTGQVQPSPEAIKAANDIAMMMTMLPRGGEGEAAAASAPRRLPVGEPRNLPAQTPATGTMGLYQRAVQSGAINDAGIDPMWVETVMQGRPPTGNVVEAGGQGTTLGSGTVIPFPKGGSVPKDPKVNLERRMARRGVGNEVVPESEFYYQSSKREAAKAKAERSSNMQQRDMDKLNAAINKYGSVDAIPDDVATQIVTRRDPAEPSVFETLADARFHAANPEIRDPSKMRESLTKGLKDAKTKADLQKRIEELAKQHGIDLPDFP